MVRIITSSNDIISNNDAYKYIGKAFDKVGVFSNGQLSLVVPKQSLPIKAKYNYTVNSAIEKLSYRRFEHQITGLISILLVDHRQIICVEEVMAGLPKGEREKNPQFSEDDFSVQPFGIVKLTLADGKQYVLNCPFDVFQELYSAAKKAEARFIHLATKPLVHPNSRRAKTIQNAKASVKNQPAKALDKPKIP